MALFDLIKPQICELGKIKIGGRGAERQAQSGGTYRMPEKYDHFVVTGLHRVNGKTDGDLVQDKPLMAALQEKYGDSDGKLRQIPIALLSNDLEEVLQCSCIMYQGKRVAARSDGVTLVKFHDKTAGWLATPTETAWKPEYAELKDGKGNRHFKLHTTFNCVISAAHSKWGGVYKFRTTSKITASQLLGSLMHLQKLTGGILRGLPLRLVVRPIQVSPEGKTTTVYVVHVEMIGQDLQQVQELALKRAKFEVDNRRQLNRMALEYRELLSDPGTLETESEAAEIGEEFHPEGNQEETTYEADPLAEQLGIMPGAANGTNGTHEEKPAKEEKKPDAPPPVVEPAKTEKPATISKAKISRIHEFDATLGVEAVFDVIIKYAAKIDLLTAGQAESVIAELVEAARVAEEEGAAQ